MMYHLVFQACLAAAPAQCGQILLPAADSPDRAECLAGAGARVRDWLAARPDLTGGDPDCRANADLPALPLEQIAPGIWVTWGAEAQMEEVADGHIANLGVVLGRDGVAVIDAGVSRAQGQALHVAIRRITDLPVAHLVLTHMHPDHALGAEVMAEAGARIHAHHALPDALAARAEGYLDALARLYGPGEWIGTRVVMPDALVRDRARIGLGDRDLTLRAWPTAHTDNDLTVMVEDARVFFAGDLLFSGLTPVVDGSLLGWLDWLEGDPAAGAALIVPGHGQADADWTRLSDPQRRLLKALAEAARDAVAQGLPLSRAVPVIVDRLNPLKDGWHAFGETMARNATAAYTELEWE